MRNISAYDAFNWFWIIGGDHTRFWSSAAGIYVEALPANWFPTTQGAADAATDTGDFYVCSRIASESELDDVLAVYGILGPTARRKVRKSIVQARLIEAGKMDAAYTALMASPIYFARWFAPDHPEVYADDPDALMLLAAIGADPETIMAP